MSELKSNDPDGTYFGEILGSDDSSENSDPFATIEDPKTKKIAKDIYENAGVGASGEALQNLAEKVRYTGDILAVDFDNARITGSSGQVVTVIDKKNKDVLQIYLDQDLFKRIASMRKNNFPQPSVTFNDDEGNYTIWDHISFFDSFDFEEAQALVVSICEPLHAKFECIFPGEDVGKAKAYQSFIVANEKRIRRDIYRALTALANCGIYHGDATLDNIGIKNGNFVLFDFNSMQSKSDSDGDISKFESSMKFVKNYEFMED